MNKRATSHALQVVLGTSLALALPAGLAMLSPQPAQSQDAQIQVVSADGGYVIATPVYQARVSSDGRLTSLRLGESERLREPGLHVRSGGQVAALTPVAATGTTVTAGGGERSVAYTFETSAIRLRAQAPGGETLVLAPGTATRRALRHDDGAPAGSEKRWTWQRWVAADGSAIALRPGPRYSLVSPPEEPVELPIPVVGVLTARLDVEPHPNKLDLLEGLVISHDADHVFPTDETPRFSVRLTNANLVDLAVEVRAELKSYTGQAVSTSTIPETVHSEERRTVPLRFEGLAPGFYDLAVTLALPGGMQRRCELTFGTQPERVRSQAYRERDFRAFWQRTLAELKTVPVDAVVTRDPTRSTAEVQVSKVAMASLGNPPSRIYGWYCTPATAGKHAALLVLPGYGDGPIPPPVGLARRGYAALSLQIRGHEVENGAYRQPARYMTEGIEFPESYVYRFIIMHGIRGLDFLASRAEVDAERIGVLGGSQGGGLALVTAALDRRVRVAAADIPFLCDFPQAVAVAGSPYREIADYLTAHPERRAEVFRVLSYFDALNHAANVRCPTVVCASLRDRTCPAPTIVATYGLIPGRRKEIYFLPFTGHTTTPAYARIRNEFVDTVLQPQIVR